MKTVLELESAFDADALVTIARRARVGYSRGLTCAHLRLVDACGREILIAYERSNATSARGAVRLAKAVRSVRGVQIERRGEGNVAIVVAVALPSRRAAAVLLSSGHLVKEPAIGDEHLAELAEAVRSGR